MKCISGIKHKLVLIHNATYLLTGDLFENYKSKEGTETDGKMKVGKTEAQRSDIASHPKTN